MFRQPYFGSTNKPYCLDPFIYVLSLCQEQADAIASLTLSQETNAVALKQIRLFMLHTLFDLQ